MLNKIRSKYVAQIIFRHLREDFVLKLVKYNIAMQKRLNISIQDYKEYKNIVLEIIPIIDVAMTNVFINLKKEDINNVRIYFDDKLVNSNYFEENERISKIKIFLKINGNSLNGLFSFCDCIKEITFIKFKKYNIINMTEMFYNCRNLIKITFNDFYTANVVNMSGMFAWCTALKELDLTKFKTEKVTSMNDMFFQCNSLEKLNVSSFDTKNVKNMYSMFNKCSSLVELDLSSFQTSKVTNMIEMFNECSKLKTLNIYNFDINDNIKSYNIFNQCKLNTIYNMNQKIIKLTNNISFEDLKKKIKLKIIKN